MYYLVLVQRRYDGKMKGLRVKKQTKSKRACEHERDRLEKTIGGMDADYRVVDEAGYKKLHAEREKIFEENRKAGAERRKKSIAQRKKEGRKPHFILCPTCNAKSKKLFSEMGGFQTRRCQNGHAFEVDTFFKGMGWVETNKRRVERTDRPLYVMAPGGGPGNYVDYILGRYKDDPAGKKDR
jgi:hypothetical protein